MLQWYLGSIRGNLDGIGVSGGDVILSTNGYYAPLSSVTSLNTLTGDLLLQAGANTAITPSGNTLTISSSGGLTGITAGHRHRGYRAALPSPTVYDSPGGQYQADRIATAQVVKDVNGLRDSVTLAPGPNTTLTPSGNTITIGSAGPVTGVTAGTGLTGGGIRAERSLSEIANGGVNTPQLADNAVTAPKIAGGQVVKSLNGLTDSRDAGRERRDRFSGGPDHHTRGLVGYGGLRESRRLIFARCRIHRG